MSSNFWLMYGCGLLLDLVGPCLGTSYLSQDAFFQSGAGSGQVVDT